MLGGCSQNPAKPWGKNATISPGWRHVKRSASEAFTAKSTWIPLAGAAVFGATSLDKRVSDYARAKTPVFGSESGAMNTSDKLLHSSGSIFWATTLAVPMFASSASSKTNNLSFQAPNIGSFSPAAAGGVAVGLTNGFTGEIKRLAKRTRPRGGSNDSLPSAHASSSTILTNMSRSNLHLLTSNVSLQRASDFSLGTMAGATAWARVEGGVHYPSDVLLGIALANFFANFVNKAFLNPNFENRLNLQLIKNNEQTGIAFKFNF